MIRKKSISETISTFAILALLALAGPLSARTPTSVPLPGPASAFSNVDQTRNNDHALLYQKLCGLNENWANQTPDFEILADVNSMDGDVSLIQAHLKLVIRQLQLANVGHLSESQLAQRLDHLQALKAYMAKGTFPQNVFVAGRRPVFIDPWGTHCAVGHLIATSGHSRLANKINREHQLDFLCDIKTDGLLAWQQASGLSLDELALIQPTYRSTTLKYPQEIESLILGNSKAIVTEIENGDLTPNAICGGKTLLHFAAAAGDLTLVKLLVENGADLHAVSEIGCDKAELAKGGRQTVVTVRWNQSTSVTSRGGMGMGIYGAVFQSKRGQFIAGILNDFRGGRVGLNALDYATESPRHYGLRSVRYPRSFPGGYGRKPEPEDVVITTLKKNRAAVAAWLAEQGLTVK